MKNEKPRWAIGPNQKNHSNQINHSSDNGICAEGNETPMCRESLGSLRSFRADVGAPANMSLHENRLFCNSFKLEV
jgi:hypothetical protein